MKSRGTTTPNDGGKIITVTGPLGPADAGVTDAHNHIWISPVDGALPNSPILDDPGPIEKELQDFSRRGRHPRRLPAWIGLWKEAGAAIQVHTERGAQMDRIVDMLVGFGIAPDRLVLCHVDKRADFGLHRDLAQRNVLLEYDTFYRDKYQPE